MTLTLDGVLYVKVEDPVKTSYGVEDPEYAVTQLAQTSTRSELGKLVLDQVFEERQKLNMAIVDAINEAAIEPWGIRCMRYEIRLIIRKEKYCNNRFISIQNLSWKKLHIVCGS